ncbi:MAG TPA: SirB2 family protein [Pseudomonadales bacterium]|nr:SirB2 family protein [Pseudomonadales bacterium]
MIFWIKSLHILCATLSISGFFVRGLWMLRDSAYLQRSWVKILPHVIDSVLLFSGVSLAVLLQQNPLQQQWLQVKLLLLLLYIVLGSIALKRGRNKFQKTVAWLGALLVVLAIVVIASQHHVLFPVF